MIITAKDVELYKQRKLAEFLGDPMPPRKGVVIEEVPADQIRTRTPRSRTGRTAVYIAYGELNAPLYVGISNHWARRWVQHGHRPFFGETIRLDIEWFGTREQAEARERMLIESLRPAHNINGVPEVEDESE